MEKNNAILRLKKVLLCDKINMPSGLLHILKGDISKVLQSYFEIEDNSLKIEVDTDTDGKYDIKIYAKAERVKSPKFLD